MTPALKRKREDVSLPSSLTIEKMKRKVERCLPEKGKNTKKLIRRHRFVIVKSMHA
jgi:hypothetical protein